MPVSSDLDVASPQPSTGSNEEFDALIDLLATDGTEGTAGGLGLELRDAEGRLDFAKIRSFFVQRNPDECESDGSSVHAAPQTSSNNAQRAFDMMTETNASTLSGLSRTPVSSSTPVASDAVPALRTINYAKEDAFDILETEKDGSQRVRHAPPLVLSDAQVVRNLDHNLQLANEELRALRGRYAELQSMVFELLDHPDDAAKSRVYHQPRDSDMRREFTRQGDKLIPDATNTVDPPLPREELPPSIESLSESQAKLTLADLLQSLGLPIDPHVIRPSHSASHPEPISSAVNSVDDIQAAIHFLRRVDELVWRRKQYPDAPWGPHRRVFSKPNIASIFERLELWENMARSVMN